MNSNEKQKASAVVRISLHIPQCTMQPNPSLITHTAQSWWCWCDSSQGGSSDGQSEWSTVWIWPVS